MNRNKTTNNKLGGRYYDNYFIKIAAREPFPIVAVSARIPLPNAPNIFADHSVPNTSIAFVSGLADLQHYDANGAAAAAANSASQLNNNDNNNNDDDDDDDDDDKNNNNDNNNNNNNKAYVLTYGVGNAESHATQVSHAEVEALFAAMEPVRDAEKRVRETRQAVAKAAAAAAAGADSAASTGGSAGSGLVLDYHFQDEGSKVCVLIVGVLVRTCVLAANCH
jgi:hypothetical protein